MMPLPTGTTSSCSWAKIKAMDLAAKSHAVDGPDHGGEVEDQKRGNVLVMCVMIVA